MHIAKLFIKKSNGQGSDEKKLGAREMLWKSRHFTGLEFGEAVEKYVIICGFTGVARIL